MAGKTDLLRERYQQFSQGDVEGALSNWSDDFVWEGGNSEDMPGGGTHEGKDAAVQVLQQAVGAWDEFNLVADEVLRGRRHGRRARPYRGQEGRPKRQAAGRAHLAFPQRRRGLPTTDPHRHPAGRTHTRQSLIRHVPAPRGSERLARQPQTLASDERAPKLSPVCNCRFARKAVTRPSRSTPGLTAPFHANQRLRESAMPSDP